MTASTAGITANHSTVRMSSLKRYIKADRRRRAERRADRVERLAKAERRAPLVGRRQIGDERIARRASDPLADAIEKAGEQHEPDGVGEREERLGDSGEAIARHRERLAPPEHIRQPAGEDAGDLRRGLGNALHHAKRGCARAERNDQEDGEQAMDQLG